MTARLLQVTAHAPPVYFLLLDGTTRAVETTYLDDETRKALRGARFLPRSFRRAIRRSADPPIRRSAVAWRRRVRRAEVISVSTARAAHFGDLVTFGAGLYAHKIVGIDRSGVYVDCTNHAATKRFGNYYVPYALSALRFPDGQPIDGDATYKQSFA